VLPESTAPSSPQPTAEAIDRAAVAELLSISKTTAKAWEADGRLPAPVIHIGRVLRWNRLELLAWLAAGAPGRILWNQIKEASIRRFLAARAA
jgi:predicted DNA-binding transcriptional regulator AlpA